MLISTSISGATQCTWGGKWSRVRIIILNTNNSKIVGIYTYNICALAWIVKMISSELQLLRSLKMVVKDIKYLLRDGLCTDFLEHGRNLFGRTLFASFYLCVFHMNPFYVKI